MNYIEYDCVIAILPDNCVQQICVKFDRSVSDYVKEKGPRTHKVR